MTFIMAASQIQWARVTDGGHNNGELCSSQVWSRRRGNCRDCQVGRGRSQQVNTVISVLTERDPECNRCSGDLWYTSCSSRFCVCVCVTWKLVALRCVAGIFCTYLRRKSFTCYRLQSTRRWRHLRCASIFFFLFHSGLHLSTTLRTLFLISQLNAVVVHLVSYCMVYFGC